MKIFYKTILTLTLAFCFISCEKRNATPAEEQLPEATMEGKNTFGAYVNGKLWLPKGTTNYFPSNLNVRYNPESMDGLLDIVVFREGEKKEYLYLFTEGINQEGAYDLSSPEQGTGSFESGTCYYDRNDDVYREGKLEITKLDMKNGIIAGIFEFTLAKPGCDTIRVTEGRFDKKLF